MKRNQTSMKAGLLWCVTLVVFVHTGCQPGHSSRAAAPKESRGANAQAGEAAAPALDACQFVLIPHTGDALLDKQIAQAQEAVRAGRTPAVALERLGWLFVAKARSSFDDGFYKRAEQCALCLNSRQPGDAGAMLLRGHVLHNLHRFKEAEPIARHLASTRGAAFDYGLLGDVLMELGHLNEAAAAYQKMMDLRPDSRALARAAHLRWLKGDLPGAVAAMQEAARSVGSREAESAAWMHTRLGFYHLASGEAALADEACAAALRLQTDYAPALLLQGRAHLAVGEGAEAVEPLQRAVRFNPLPEYQWALAEALFESGSVNEAHKVQAELRKHGAERDPRTFALYLATRCEDVEVALSLAQHELKQRADVFTHDALAWCLARADRLEEARIHMKMALAEGTSDGRLFFHAAVIAAKSGRADEARRFRARAESLAQLLLPSERLQLQTAVPDYEPKQAGAAGVFPQCAPHVVSASGP
jgi:tetratricopeptide (TPR) repeat protein